MTKRATVTIVYASDWEIHHFFLSPSDDDEWGPDQLGKDVIKAKGGSYKLTDIACDTWDVKLVDEDGDECVVEEVDLCREDATWKLTNQDLLKCEAATD
jgi:hypothetical protein